jgi:aminopeptidase N
VSVNDTEEAVNVFDRICYEKGACFIKQMSNFVGVGVLKVGMHQYFTKYALKNTTLPDFIECLENASKIVGDKNVDIQAWTNSWLTKAGANEIKADYSSLDSDGQGSFTIAQFLPRVEIPIEKVYQQQVMNIKFIGEHQKVHIQQFMLEGPQTTIESTCKFEVKAALPNSGTLGYARVLLDDASIAYFLANMKSVKDQADRTYIWMILRDHIKLLSVSPKAYLECIILNIDNESEQNTLSYLLSQVSFMMDNWINPSD